MSQHRNFRDELDPSLEASELDALAALAERLEAGRPVPAAGFRGELRRHLLGIPKPGSTRPARLRLLVAGYLGSGLALLAIASIGLAGAGPFAV